MTSARQLIAQQSMRTQVDQENLVADVRRYSQDRLKLRLWPALGALDITIAGFPLGADASLLETALPLLRANPMAVFVTCQVTVQQKGLLAWFRGETPDLHLVDIKEWIAAQENAAPIDSSKIETALVFFRAGGDFDTGVVSVEDVLTLLQGRQPTGFGEVTLAKLTRARKMARWHA